MIRWFPTDNGFRLKLLAGVVVAAFAFAGLAPAADAQRNRDNERSAEQSAAERTFSTAIGEIVLRAQEQQTADQWAASIESLNTALGRQNITPFERMVVLQMRGRAYFETDRVNQAITDWRGAIATGVMTADEANSLRINIGQLLLANDQYNEGIQEILAAVQAGAQLNDRLAMMLAQAYAQTGRYSEGLRYAEQAFQGANPPERRHFNLMLFYYQQLDRVPDQMRLVQQMVERWPGEKTVLQSWASLLAQTGREREAFEANKIMYVNGMLTTSSEIVHLAQYYSYYEFPYRGAVILEREMNAGRVERTQQNITLLANMWRQAREFERGIPVLRQLAQMTNAGTDYQTLAEALYQIGQMEAAEAALQQALSRGGLRQTGEAWVMLGTVRYELGRRDGAVEAFQRATQYPAAANSANGWLRFVREEIRFAEERPRILERLRQDSCRFTVEDNRELSVFYGTDDPVTGRRLVDIPDECRDLYNQFGEPIGAAAAAAAEQGTEG